MDLTGSFLWRVVRPLSVSLHAQLLWEQGRRQGLMELLLVDELVSAGEVAVDVGANFGLFARRLARLVGRAGHLYLFEPHPDHHEQLRRFGKSPQVTYLPLALSDRTGTAELQVPRYAGASVESMATLEEDAPPVEGFDKAFDRVRVQVDTFDRALECEPRPISFVKCDVEGHELAFLRGARGRLTRDHPTLLLEIEQRHQRRDVNETFALLDEFGYDGWVVRPDGLAPHASFDVERDQRAILRALPPGGDVGRNYLNTFLFVSRRRPLPVGLPQARGSLLVDVRSASPVDIDGAPADRIASGDASPGASSRPESTLTLHHVRQRVVNYVQRVPPLEMLGRSAQGERLVVLRSLTGKRRLTVLDHPVKPVARYPYPRRSHERLDALLSENQTEYAKLLDSFLGYEEALAAIPTHPAANARDAHWMNEWQPPLDGIALYCLLRLHRPQRYVEIGSGVSTQFARRAIADGDTSTTVMSIDPKPRAEIDQLCDRVIRQPLEEVDPAVFDELVSGDVLFFDGSHRTFMNSDATVFFLDVLPRLPAGVLVGIHDIYLPFDYPDDVADRYYSEQYLLAARLLAEGQSASVVLPTALVAARPRAYASLTELEERLGEAVAAPLTGSSFWFQI